MEQARTDFDELRSRVEAELDAIRQRVAMLNGDWQTTGQRQVRRVEDTVQERPFVSLAVALATGLVTGWLLNRR